ncbi:ankyrin repeat-containing domain protein [Dendryphion nanum]|uniref:Ankyrin repeat-containing domain protein n=1 Tax=Dendryphion nanum TaxID=256645 RepID=A0A9P9IA71_9PLEO|nr:ankyrin repeat-containing domain protein [Dendryphion nanum]
MAGRRTRNDEWELHKDEIYTLFITKDHKISEVAELMTQRHGFTRTYVDEPHPPEKAQYQTTLKKWCFNKNIGKEDWLVVSEHVKKRKAKGRESWVNIRGTTIPVKRLKKEMSRYEYMFTPFRRPISDRNSLHPYIHIYTPPRSPEMTPALSPSLPYLELDVVPTSENAFLEWAGHTPWYRFMKFIRILEIEGPPLLLSVPQHPENRISFDRSQSTSNIYDEIIRTNQRYSSQEWIDDIAMASFLQFDDSIPDEWTNPGRYLPPTRDMKPDIDVNNMLDLSLRSTQLEFIKLAIHLISNRKHTFETIEAIANLLEVKCNLSLLKSLLDQKLLVVEAFFEKLFQHSVHYGNLSLLRILVEDEDEAEKKLKTLCSEYNYALEFAIEYNHDDMVTYLLDHDVIAPGLIADEHFNWKKSLLDCAVGHKNMRIIQELLTPRSSFMLYCTDVSIETLRVAVLTGDHDIIQILVDHNPELLDQMNSEPWLLYEAASTHKTVATLMKLQNWGMDVTATDEKGYGSALAVACRYADMVVIQHLLDLGVDINGIAFGLGYYPSLNDDPEMNVTFLEHDTLTAMRDKTALCIAVEQEDESLVNLLLYKGADPNRFLHVSPLQTAAMNGNVAIAETLIKADANVNAVVNPSLKNSKYRRINEDITNKTAIHLALERGHQSIVELLMKSGAVIPNGVPELAIMGEEWNPLQAAIIGGNRSLVHWIMERVDINYWATPSCLAICVRVFGWSFAKTLFDDRISAYNFLKNPQILCECVYLGDQEAVETLVSDTKALLGKLPCGYGAIGLAVAAQHQRTSMLQVFLDAGAMPYDSTPKGLQYGKSDYSVGGACTEIDAGTSALEVAVRYKNIDVLKFLLDACGSILSDTTQVTQNRGILQAYRAAIGTGNRAVLDEFLKVGLNVRQVDDAARLALVDKYRCTSIQWYMLHTRSSRPSPEFIDILLDHDADPNAPAEGNFILYGLSEASVHTPLQSAVSCDAVELVKKLLQRRINVNAEPNVKKGATALQFAAINGNFEILNMLLKAGANVHAPPASFDGRSAIEGASEWGRLDMVTYLLGAGVDIRGRKNKNYRRSIYRAWDNGHRTLARTIQDWKAAKFGAEDCEDIETIYESMTEEELYYGDLVDVDEMAREHAVGRGQGDVTSTSRNGI